MCGIVGMLGDISYQMRQEIFRDMLEVNATRGRDSTGVVKVKKDMEYDFVKAIGSPTYLVESRPYEKRIEQGDAAVLIGHCRKKTMGEVNVKNAHPFDFPDKGIIGVHNGTLRGHHWMDGHTYQKVDSEVLYEHLANNGPEDTFSRVDGAFACVWWDANERTVNFIRNEERPLWFTWSKDLKTMFWASEPWMFSVVARKLELWDGDDNCKKFYELPVRELWSCRVNPHAKGDEKIVTFRPAKEIAKVVEKKSYTPSHLAWRNGTTGTGHNFHRNPDGSYTRGGEVKDPFLEGRREQIAEAFLLDDPLPPHVRTGGPVEQSNSEISNVSFLRQSVERSASTHKPKDLKKSPRNILSLNGKNSKTKPSTSNDEPSNDTSGCSSVSSPASFRSGVSFRTVTGMRYITDNPSGIEFLEKDFLQNTDGICCYCKEPIGDIIQVGRFVNKFKFVCETCLEQPADLVVPCVC